MNTIRNLINLRSLWSNCTSYCNLGAASLRLDFWYNRAEFRKRVECRSQLRVTLGNDGLPTKSGIRPQGVYYLLDAGGALVFTLTVIGIRLLPLWFPIGFPKRYLDRMECLLTESALKVSKEILIRVEKIIPLGKITDMGMIQGPIMRRFGLYTLTVEIAG